MSIILGKYKNIKRLGKGAFGDVLLVKDEEQNEYAVKMINKKLIQKDPYLEEYLEGEKDCMMNMKSSYIMQLLAFEEDDKYKYMVCQYCNGGDLLNHQARQPNKVYQLNTAVEILSEIIRGLQLLHEAGYVHRDIKPQNILIKNDQNGKSSYKLADFGFAKKSNDVGGTVLGTEHYMSPQIYLNEVYGYEVDMWAFGVLLYFMLNMDYPFRTNPHATIEKKRSQLLKQTVKFSYKEAVSKSKKKIMQNCTPEMQNLFDRIFTEDPEERINWVEIRQHPIFKKEFPVIHEASIILYKNKNKGKDNRLVSFVQKKNSLAADFTKKETILDIEEKKVQSQIPDDIPISIVMKRNKHKEFPQQKHYLELKYEKIKFLLESEEEMIEANAVMSSQEIFVLRFNFLKYYTILLKQFIHELKAEILDKEVHLRWVQFLNTKEFKAMLRQYKSQEQKLQLRLQHLYDICFQNIQQISKFNPDLESTLSFSVQQGEKFDNIKKAYRNSTQLAFIKLRKVFKKGNKYLYLTAIIIICHAFNKTMEEDDEDLKDVYMEFLQNPEPSKKAKILDFSHLRHSLTKSSEDRLKKLIKKLISRYFS